MLKRAHLQDHQDFLQTLYQSGRVGQQALLRAANFEELRTVILIFASLFLKQIPATLAIRKRFIKSKRKKLLKRTFYSWKKVSKLLLEDRATLLALLVQLRPLISTALGAIFEE